MKKHYGRDNRNLWDNVNWTNSFSAIARRMNCTTKAVRYQAQKRGIKSSNYPRGGNQSRGCLPYTEGTTPLPHNIQL